MPVVTINIKRLVRLVGPRLGKTTIIDALPYLGLDIESIDGDSIKVEYSPNRPNYATDYGIAEALRGSLGVKTGGQKITVKKSTAYTIRVSSSLARIRPIIMGIVARRVSLDENSLKQLISMQEDLHEGIGRRRRISSIGIHDMSTITFPLEYTTAPRSTKLVPLNSERELTLEGVLKDTDVGRQYANLVEGHTRVPVILDAKDNIISFPPVINSAQTALTRSTRQIFVEVTGTDTRSVEDTLSIVASTLASAGCELVAVHIIGGPKTHLQSRKMTLRPSLVYDSLGIKMSTSQIIACLRRSRLDATMQGSRISCTIPRHRFDILGEMDLVEEVALGYGINNIDPLLPPQESAGQASDESAMLDTVSDCMVGLGYTEALNSGLVNKSSLDDLAHNKTKMISVMEPKNQVHTILRDSLIPGLLDVLSRNVHETYPQHLYEIGTVFAHAKPVKEKNTIAAVTAHKNANYTQAKSAAVAVLLHCFGAKPTTVASSHPALEEGHAADILVNGVRVGVIGDVRTGVLERLRIRERVAVFEIDLSALAKTSTSIKN